MIIQRSSTDTREHPQVHNSLSGRWLLIARVAWVVVTLLILGLNIGAIPHYYAVLQTVCVAPMNCFNDQFTPVNVQGGLHASGDLVGIYAGVTVALHVLSVLVCVILGALLLWYRSEELIVLFCAFMLVLFGCAGLSNLLLEGLAPLSLGWYAVVYFLGFLGQVSFLLFFYLFPTGHFVPRWTRWTALLYAVYWAWTIISFHPGRFISLLDALVFFGLILTAVVAQVYRYRRVSTPVQRQQTKWVVFGFTLFIVGFILLVSVDHYFVSTVLSSLDIVNLIGSTLVNNLFLLIPCSIVLAILRYHLWDINIIINRTLVYGTLTASIVSLYVLLVTALGAALRAQGNLLISLFATGLIAVLFQPWRAVLQRGVNRLLYGQRDEPYTVITRLSQRLKGTLEPEAVLSTIVETVAQALRLPYAAILWKQEETFELAASYGRRAEEPVTLPLVYQAETIGQLQLASRAPGEAFAPADMRLLDELARQAGLATHSVRLATDLQKARERLVLAREEERRRLRRNLHDGVGPTLASLSQRIDTACHLVRSEPDIAIVQLRNLKAQIKSTIGDIRRVVYELRPPVLDELGLVSAIREHVMPLQGMNSLHISVEAPADVPPLPAAVEVAAYHITLGALTNVESHAHARHCLVRLELADERSLCLSIIDDGQGLSDDYRAGVGITSMRERAAELGGEFTLTAKPGGGTHVQVRLPLKS